MEDSVTTSSLNQTDFRDNSEGVNVQGKSIILSKQSTIAPRHKKTCFCICGYGAQLVSAFVIAT